MVIRILFIQSMYLRCSSRDRRMHHYSLWHMNPQSHPVRHCSFDRQTLIFALTPIDQYPDTVGLSSYEFFN